MGNGASSSGKDAQSSTTSSVKRTSRHRSGNNADVSSAHQVTKIQSFDDSEQSSNPGDSSSLVQDENFNPNLKQTDDHSKLKSLNAIKESFSSQEPEVAFSNLPPMDGHNVVKFHRTDPQWMFDLTASNTFAKELPQIKEFTRYTWQGMQKMRRNLWLVELVREPDILDEKPHEERLAVLMQVDPNREKFLSMQGMLCMLGQKLDIKMPRVLLIDSSNSEEYQHVLNQIEEVAGTSLQSSAKASESILIYQYLPSTQPLDHSLFEQNISQPAFRTSLANIMAFDILVNNQSHIPCLFATRGHPENLVVSQDSHELIPIENKTIILSAKEDIEVYCSNVETFLRNRMERRENLEECIKRFCKIHFNVDDVQPSHLNHIWQKFEERLSQIASLDEPDVLRMLEDISNAYPSVSSQLKPQFYLRVQQTMKKVVSDQE
mmetsp:Transcript_4334/g.16292  ORF Transcript_4334/g.16292 Transcript_4334/m.16292 type:complete len:434 (-) Transcript_4334:872-2173(-)|eukprot:CAMPEP_0117441670 /NCGR_PEP_ID=MMETSP0759-20121206/3753_1 /TAXON_ID=63605 /ORGANISM="Percolomonas cosmopolitus, Strain WS" /LENGTH=433 /DNA_ID=CAMNT_0005233529 /DNA_START=279 /DNA_END=1580 /DNA_ORIENTATION=-